MESNKAKGWITDEDIAKAKEIIATVSAEKAAELVYRHLHIFHLITLNLGDESAWKPNHHR